MSDRECAFKCKKKKNENVTQKGYRGWWQK